VLRYESTGRVPAKAVRRILEESGAIERDWWKGLLGFDAAEEDRPSLLSGRTSLFYSTGIPDDDDLFMAFADVAFILGRLADWSKRFKIKWHLRMHEEDWGAVDPSGATRPLIDQMEKWARRIRTTATGRDTWYVAEDRRTELLRRHAGRRGRGAGGPKEV